MNGEDDDSQIKTTIQFDLYFGCDEYNKGLTSDTLTARFNKNFIPNFATHSTIQTLFIFSKTGETTVEQTPTPPTIEPKEPVVEPEPDENSCFHFHQLLSFLSLHSLIILLFVDV